MLKKTYFGNIIGIYSTDYCNIQNTLFTKWYVHTTINIILFLMQLIKKKQSWPPVILLRRVKIAFFMYVVDEKANIAWMY